MGSNLRHLVDEIDLHEFCCHGSSRVESLFNERILADVDAMLESIGPRREQPRETFLRDRDRDDAELEVAEA